MVKFINKLTTLKNLISLEVILFFKGKRKSIVFDLASVGEYQFFSEVLKQYQRKYPNNLIFVAYHNNDSSELQDLVRLKLPSKVLIIKDSVLRALLFNQPDLYITSEQYSRGLDKAFSICLFHGQPSKGLTFNKAIVNSFDAFFLYGPLHRLAFDEFLQDEGIPCPEHLRLYNVGYTKSDDLINKKYSRSDVMQTLHLDEKKFTILYAPAFNEGASLREYGGEIVKRLCQNKNYNIIAKLPVDCLQPLSNSYATGGVDWNKRVQKWGSNYSNFRLFRENKIDPVLCAADLLVTCISSVSFEFLAINKPVVFIETPKFYNKFLKKKFPDRNVIELSSRVTVNAGKKFGPTVSNIKDIGETIRKVRANYSKYQGRLKNIRNFLLYNPGKATDAAIKVIDQLQKEKGLKSLRHNSNPGAAHYEHFSFKSKTYDI